jgi:hypothetical protein
MPVGKWRRLEAGVAAASDREYKPEFGPSNFGGALFKNVVAV